MVIFVKSNIFGLGQTMGGAFITGSAFNKDNTVLQTGNVNNLLFVHDVVTRCWLNIVIRF